jgi:dynein heavy chain, axonemal
MLNKFSEIIRGNLAKMVRAKVVALVTIEIHARDVIEKLAKSNCNDVNGFEWLMQLRVYWDRVKILKKKTKLNIEIKKIKSLRIETIV